MPARLAQHRRYNYSVNIMTKLPSKASLAIAAGLVVAFPSAVEAEPGVSIVMSVRASVSPTVVMKFEASPMQLSVTEDDIARGYVDVPGTYRLTINTDRPLRHLANIMVDYEPNLYNFTSLQVAARTLQTGESSYDTRRLANTQIAARTPQTAEPSYDIRRLANVQVAARTLQTDEPRSDTMLPNYINALPATAAGPYGEPQKPTAGDRGVKTFDGAETVRVRGSVTSLGYRLMLPEKIKPGNISVPLTLSLQL